MSTSTAIFLISTMTTLPRHTRQTFTARTSSRKSDLWALLTSRLCAKLARPPPPLTRPPTSSTRTCSALPSLMNTTPCSLNSSLPGLLQSSASLRLSMSLNPATPAPAPRMSTSVSLPLHRSARCRRSCLYIPLRHLTVPPSRLSPVCRAVTPAAGLLLPRGPPRRTLVASPRCLHVRPPPSPALKTVLAPLPVALRARTSHATFRATPTRSSLGAVPRTHRSVWFAALFRRAASKTSDGTYARTSASWWKYIYVNAPRRSPASTPLGVIRSRSVLDRPHEATRHIFCFSYFTSSSYSSSFSACLYYYLSLFDYPVFGKPGRGHILVSLPVIPLREKRSASVSAYLFRHLQSLLKQYVCLLL